MTERAPDRPTTVEYHHLIEFDGVLLHVRQSRTADLPTGGLPDHLWAEQARIAVDRARRVVSKVREHPRWPEWENRSGAFWKTILSECFVRQGDLLVLAAYTAPPPDVRRSARIMFIELLDLTLGRAHPVVIDGALAQATPRPEIVEAFADLAPTLAAFAQEVLRASDHPVDDWHQAVVLAELLCPSLAAQVVPPQFWLTPPPPGQTDRERQSATAVSAPDTTERAATAFKRDIRDRAGAVVDRAKPGPRTGSGRKQSRERADFEARVMRLSRDGVSAALICDDAECARLYRLARRDPLATLHPGAIYRVLKVRTDRHAGPEDRV